MASWRKSTPSRSAARHQREAGATSNREQASIQAPAGTSAPAAPSRRDSATKWAAWLLVALVAVVYGRTANFDFLSWDDGYHVTQNPWLNPPSTTGLAHLWKQPYFGLYAPVAYTAFAAESLVSGWLPGAADSSGLQPWVFHLGSVMLHAINSLLVYRLLRRMVGQTWPAAAGAALFASHPLQVEAVAWISETRGLLSALFGLLAILIMLPGADLHRLDQSRWRSGLRWGLATACYLAALCSKPTAVVVPALLLVIAWAWPRLYRHDHLDDPAGDASDTALGSVIAGMRRLGWSWIALLLVWTTIGLSFAIGTSHLQHHVALSTSLPWYVRPFAALAGTGFYLGKLCLPVDLAPDYGWRTPVMASPQWRYAWSVVPLLAAALLTLRRRTIDRRWWAVALVTLVAVAPTSGIVSSAFQAISLVADRYFYLAMLGPALGMALWLVRQKPTTQTVARVSRQQRRRHTSEPTPPAQTNWRWPLAWGGLAVCGVLSFVQCGHWSTDVSVASRMLEVNRRSFVALTQRGHAAARNGDPATAAESYRAALHANPNYPLAWFNWGVLHLKQRKWNTAARDFERALE
ncbi:MAG: tetratricopeptide repeat protein, partial [Pirellulales bacterium]